MQNRVQVSVLLWATTFKCIVPVHRRDFLQLTHVAHIIVWLRVAALIEVCLHGAV